MTSAHFLAFLRDDDGATAIEYGMIVTLVFLAIVGAVTAFTNSANTMFSLLSAAIGAAL